MAFATISFFKSILETFFMNLFHGGRLATMPPKLLNEEGDVFVYRPLAHVAEADCEKFARDMRYPIIPCDLCGSQHGLQRQQVKQILDGWEATQKEKKDPVISDIPIIALTAHSMAADKERAINAGCSEYETKPIDFPALLAKIYQFLEGSDA